MIRVAGRAACRQRAGVCTAYLSLMCARILSGSPSAGSAPSLAVCFPIHVAFATPLPPLSTSLISSIEKVDMPTDLILCCISRWMPEHVVQTKVLKLSTTYWLPRPVQSKHERFSARFWHSLRSF